VIIKEEKLHKASKITNFEECKSEVKKAEYYDWKRQLVDDTKKKAIYTARTYEDFTDAVKGCTLKPISNKEFNAPAKHRYNSTFGHAAGEQASERAKAARGAKSGGKLSSKSEVTTGPQFERTFRRIGASEKLSWLESIPLEKYPALFKVEFDPELFSAILKILAPDGTPVDFASGWLAVVEALPSASMLGAFATDEDKEQIRAIAGDRTSSLL